VATSGDFKLAMDSTSVKAFSVINSVYARYFTGAPPARMFVNVPAWPDHFDIEIDCIATL
jgi:2-iminobutanoate/2-iminopropanoate deaminase